MSSRRAPATMVAALVVAIAAAAALSGCDTDDGRALAEPAPGATAPPRPTGTTTSTTVGLGTPPVGSEEGSTLTLTSPSFGSGGAIPPRYACDGDDISPTMGWTGVPDGTTELALTMVDTDAPGGQFVHWVVTGIDPTLSGLDEGVLPEGAREARNGSSEFGWYGPCPPAGEIHRYVFTLFALSETSGVAPGAGGEEAIAQIARTPGEAATLSATFGGL